MRPPISRAAFVALAVAASAAPALRAQNVRVVDDPRAEAIGMLFRIAGVSDFRGASVQPFIHQVDSALTPFASHAVFAEIRKLRAVDPRLGLSAVIGIAPQLTDPITLRERAPFDSPASRLPGEWHGAAARPFLAQARDFARVAHFADLLRLEQPTFDSAATRLARLLHEKARMDWFGPFYGEPVGQIVVSPLLISNAGNFGAEFGSGATHERYAFVAFQTADRAGFPVVPNEAIEQMVHELNHSFINHLVIADSVRLRSSGQRMFRIVGQSMTEMAYDTWVTMYNESLVRASVIRYLLVAGGPDAALQETRAQQGRGFVWMDQLVTLLGQYESQRRQYPTFASFMPRVAAFFDSMAPRVADLRAEFERHRPRVVSSSIAEGTTVDATLQQIEIHFDHPVHGFRDLAGEYGGDVPTITRGAFDSTGTVLTLGVRLVPNHAYWLPFGPGSFADNDGYPLQTWELHFRTRPDQ